MSKNITRKGLALAVASALGVAAFATPAHAVVPVSIDPTTGSGYSTILGSTYSLTSYLTNSAINSGSDEFKWIITDPNFVIDVAASGALDNSAGTSYAQDGDTGVIVVDEAAAASGLPGYELSLGVNAAAITADVNTSVTVQAFVDFNGNDKVDSGEQASAVKTINWVTFKNAGLTTTLVQPKLSDTALDADISFSNADVNITTVDASDFRVDFGYITTAGAAADVYNDASTIQTNRVASSVADKNYIESTTSGTTTIVPSRQYTAQAEYNSGTWAAAGDPSKKTAPAEFADAISVVSATASADVRKDSATQYKVRAGVKTVSLSSSVTLDSAASAAGVAVDVVIKNVHVVASSGDTITIGGTVFSASKTGATLHLATGADGKVVIPVSASAAANGEYFTVDSITVLDVTGLTQTGDVTVTWLTGGYDWMETPWNDDYDLYYPKGATATVPFSVFDNFGALLNDGSQYRLYIYINPVDAGTADESYQVVNLVNGKASFSYTDKATGTGWTNTTITLQKYNSASMAWDYVDDYGLGLNFGSYGTVRAGKTIDTNITDATTTELSQENFGNFNMYATGYWGGTFPTLAKADGLRIDSYLKDADGNYVSFYDVTYSAPGAQFLTSDWWIGDPSVDNPSIYKTDSYTVRGYSSNVAPVYVYFNKSGAHVITITAGGVTKTVTVTTDDPTLADASAISLTAPTAVVPGDSADLAAVAVDAHGNVILDDPSKFTIKVTGGSTVFGASALADGEATLTIAPKAADLGNLTATVTYDVDGDLDTKDDQIVKTATIVVGLPKLTVTLPSSAQAGKAVDASVTVVDAAGKALAGRVVVVSNTGAGYTSVSTVTTDAAGKANFKLIGGASDTGLSTVTATLAGGTGSATTTFGVTDANINKAGKRVTVDWTYAAGKRVVIYRDGIQIRNFVASSDASDSFSFNLKKGTHKVTVKVGGVTVDSQSYKIK